ncbi:MAG: hypothetical protein ABSE39_12535 [Candidatus Bathyarchaeia archaeon]
MATGLRLATWIAHRVRSVAWMTVECVVAIYSGLATWILALLAFGGDSLVELVSSFAVVRHLKHSLTGSNVYIET